MDFEYKESETEARTTNWNNWWATVKNEGDSFDMNVTKVAFDEEKQVFYLFNEEGDGDIEATSVYCQHHPSSKYTKATPHGVRFAKAAIRTLKCDHNSEAIVSAINNTEGTRIIVTKKEAGVLWEVKV